MKSGDSGIADRTFLDDLSLDLTSLAAMLACYAEGDRKRRQGQARDRVTAAEVQDLLTARNARSARIGHDLCSPGWSLLLELFRPDLEKRRINLARLAPRRTSRGPWHCAGSAISPPPASSTALRVTTAEPPCTSPSPDAGREAMGDHFVGLLPGLSGA